MIISIFLYHFVLILVLLFAFWGERFHNNKYSSVGSFLIFISFLILLIFAGIRHYVGMDYVSYVEYFYGDYVTEWEPGYHFINKMFSGFTYGYKCVIFIVSLITYIFVYKSLTQENILFWGLFFFLLLFYFQTSSLIRQGVTVSIFMYSIKFIKEKKLILYLIYMLIASLFHYSALLLIPIYFLANINFSKRNMLVILLLLMSLNFLFPNLINGIFELTRHLPEYGHYIHTQFSKGDVNTGVGVILKLTMGLIMIFYSDEIKSENEKNKIYINLFYIGLILTVFATRVAIIGRLAYYFNVIGVFTFAFFLQSINFRKVSFVKLIALCFLILFSLTFFEENFYENNKKVLPYKTIFSSIK